MGFRRFRARLDTMQAQASGVMANANQTISSANTTAVTATQALDLLKDILDDVHKDGITFELENTSPLKDKSLAEIATDLLTGKMPSLSFRLRVKP